MRQDIRYPSCSQRQNRCHSKENKHQLGLFSCLKHANKLPLGDQRQADQRTQSFHFAVVIHQSLDPAARSSAQAPTWRPSFLSLLSLHVHELRALTDRLRTRRRVGSTRRRGNHMHDHSRFQCDIDDVTGVSLSLSLSLPLTKVTHAQYRKRFRASYNTCQDAHIHAAYVPDTQTQAAHIHPQWSNT